MSKFDSQAVVIVLNQFRWIRSNENRWWNEFFQVAAILFWSAPQKQGDLDEKMPSLPRIRNNITSGNTEKKGRLGQYFLTVLNQNIRIFYNPYQTLNNTLLKELLFDHWITFNWNLSAYMKMPSQLIWKQEWYPVNSHKVYDLYLRSYRDEPVQVLQG